MDLNPEESEFEFEEISDDTLNIDYVPYEPTEFDITDELETGGVGEINDEIPEVLSLEEDGISEIDFDDNTSSETETEELLDTVDDSNGEVTEDESLPETDEVLETDINLDSTTSDIEGENYVREYDDFETSVLSENPEFYETG